MSSECKYLKRTSWASVSVAPILFSRRLRDWTRMTPVSRSILFPSSPPELREKLKWSCHTKTLTLNTVHSKCGFLSSVSKVWHQYWMSISVWSVVTVDWTAGFGNWPLWERCGSIRKGWWGTCLWLNYDSTRSSDTQCPSQTTPPTIHHHTHPTTDQIHYCAQVWGL